MHQPPPTLHPRFNPAGMHQPTPHQRFNPEGNSFQHFQRYNNFGPRGRGGRGAPRGRGREHFYGASPRLDMYNNNEEHWCETCDRSFRSVELLEQHKQQHEKCNIDGCEFIAHPKVITKHIQMQHSTGLFKKIAKLRNPEDIQKWREERKKKYPTKENVAKKAAELKEKRERGEKMGLKQDKSKYCRNHRSGEPQKRKFPQNNEKTYNVKNYHKQNNIQRLKQNKAIPAAKVKQNLKPFSGIQELIIESDSENAEEPEQSSFTIEDDDAQDPVCKIELSSKIEKPVVCGALTSLMCEYGSSDDETEVADKIPQVPCVVQRITNQINSKASPTNSPLKSIDETNTVDPKIYQPTKDIKFDNKESDEDCGPEEVKVEKSIEDLTSINNDQKAHPITVTSQKNINNIQTKKCVIRRTKPKVPSTLIYKLLHKEIHQERNFVLQCIRHIVKNNYFDNDCSLQQNT